MPTKKQTLIFSIAHSYDLMFFYRLVMESNYKEKYIIKILFQEHKYFKGKMPIVNRMLLAISDKIVFVKNDGKVKFKKLLIIYYIVTLKNCLNFFLGTHQLCVI